MTQPVRRPRTGASHAVESIPGETRERASVHLLPETVAMRFRDLADWWHADTDASSLDRDSFEHPAYRRIVEELGKDAIPYILADLRDHDGHWFEALRQLTGNHSVDAGCKGNMRQARARWLRWGAEQKLI